MFRDTDPQNAGPVVAVIAASTKSPQMVTRGSLESSTFRHQINSAIGAPSVKIGIGLPARSRNDWWVSIPKWW